MDEKQLEQYKLQLFRELGYLAFARSVDAQEQHISDAVAANETMISYGFSLTPDDILMLSKYARNIYEIMALFSAAINSDYALETYLENCRKMNNWDVAGKHFRSYEKYYDNKYGVKHEPRAPVWADCDTSDVSEYKYKGSRLISLVPLTDIFSKPLDVIIEKSLILSNKKEIKNIVFTASQEVPAYYFNDKDINEKTILYEVFYGAFCQNDLEKCITICKTAPYLFQCLRAVVNKKKWHLSTSEKRKCTKLIEKLPVSEVEDYFMSSRLTQEKNIRMLELFSYNRFSKSPKHKDLIFKLRNSQIKTFESIIEDYSAEKPKLALKEMQKKPELFLKHMRKMLRRGYSEDMIKEAFLEVSSEISVGTMIAIVNSLMDDVDECDTRQTINIIKEGIKNALKKNHKELDNKRVFVNCRNVDLAKSVVISSFDDDAIRSGIVIKLPDNQLVRVYICWNAETSCDINMNCSIPDDVIPAAIRYSGDYFGEEGEEYIDIDTNEGGAIHISFEIYHGKLFSSINKCEIGAMIVDRDTGACLEQLFTHNIIYRAKYIDYGFIKPDEKRMYINARPVDNSRAARESEASIPWENGLSYKELISMICEAHHCDRAYCCDDADAELEVGCNNLQSVKDTNSEIIKININDFF